MVTAALQSTHKNLSPPTEELPTQCVCARLHFLNTSIHLKKHSQQRSILPVGTHSLKLRKDLTPPTGFSLVFADLEIRAITKESEEVFSG